jgi:hypothetical protein
MRILSLTSAISSFLGLLLLAGFNLDSKDLTHLALDTTSGMSAAAFLILSVLLLISFLASGRLLWKLLKLRHSENKEDIDYPYSSTSWE